MQSNDATTGDRRTGYDYDYVTLPPVEEGDEVRVRYVSKVNGSEQERTGTVEEVHVNGFEFDDGRDGYRTGVREHERRGEVERSVSTLSLREEGYHEGSYVHGADLNRNHRDPEETEVEVVERVDA